MIDFVSRMDGKHMSKNHMKEVKKYYKKEDNFAKILEGNDEDAKELREGIIEAVT